MVVTKLLLNVLIHQVKCNHVCAILFAMEGFHSKGLKEFHEPFMYIKNF